MTSTFSWLDVDDEQRRKMLAVVELFKEDGTVDELWVARAESLDEARALDRRHCDLRHDSGDGATWWNFATSSRRMTASGSIYLVAGHRTSRTAASWVERKHPVERWPDVGVAVWAELDRGGRFALLCGAGAEEVAASLADLRGATPAHVGALLTEASSPPSEAAVRSALRGRPMLTGLQVLFDPVLRIEPVRLLAALAREQPPIAAVWPVDTTVHRLSYPQGVRPGHDPSLDLQGCLLLTTRSITFADDVPFVTERFR